MGFTLGGVGRSIRQTLIQQGRIDPDVKPTGGFGSGLVRIASGITPILEVVAPGAALAVKILEANFPPGQPPEALPQPVTPTTAAARLGQPGRFLSALEERQLEQVLEGAIAQARANRNQQILRLPSERLISDQSGGTGLRKFIAPLRRQPLATDIVDAIQPCQEMLVFQDEVLTIGTTVAGQMGKVVTFRITVPTNEAWQLDDLSMFILNGDRLVNVSLNRNGVEFLLVRTIVPGVLKGLIYRRNELGALERQQDYLPPEKLRMYAGDLLTIDTAALLVNGNVQLNLMYRRIPLPKLNELSPTPLIGTQA